MGVIRGSSAVFGGSVEAVARSAGATFLVQALEQPSARHGRHGQMVRARYVLQIGKLLFGQPEVEHPARAVRSADLRARRVWVRGISFDFESTGIFSCRAHGLLINRPSSSFTAFW